MGLGGAAGMGPSAAACVSAALHAASICTVPNHASGWRCAWQQLIQCKYGVNRHAYSTGIRNSGVPVTNAVAMTPDANLQFEQQTPCSSAPGPVMSASCWEADLVASYLRLEPALQVQKATRGDTIVTARIGDQPCAQETRCICKLKTGKSPECLSAAPEGALARARAPPSPP
jgi:hypothetical protein